MLQMFIDDSGSGGDSRFYILAGFKARVAVWEAFSDDWKAVLDSDPKIAYFKMSEAESLKGPFKGFSKEQRNKKVNKFIDVIDGHDIWLTTVALPQQDYDQIIRPASSQVYATPYLYAFMWIVMACAGHTRQFGQLSDLGKNELWNTYDPDNVEKIDFIFDRQKPEEDDAKRHYELIRTYAEWAPLVGSIRYEDEKQFLPLQAADLAAWQNRRRLCVVGEGTRPQYHRLYTNPLRFFRKTFQTQDLLRMKAPTQKQQTQRTT